MKRVARLLAFARRLPGRCTQVARQAASLLRVNVRSVLFTVGFASLCAGLGWWVHPGAGLVALGLGLCVPLALLRLTGMDQEGA